MKKFTLLKALCVLSFLVLSFQACKSDDDGANYQMENQTFVTQALNSNKFEVAAATVAQSKATSAQVKQFASRMATEHTALGVDLTDLAKSMELAIPGDLESKEQANINTLGLLTGPAFEAEFKRLMIEYHQASITLFQTASSKSGVPGADLRNFAGNKVSSLQAHLKEAQSLTTTAQ
jgi:putative membrane protein